MMNQQKKQGFRSKISSYFRMLCGRPTDAPKQELQSPAQHRPTVKRKRLTFMLDRALIKLSRKNIAGDEFSAKQQVQQQVERHLAQRLTGVAMGIFMGPFGETVINSVYFPIQILPSSPPPVGYITPNNEIVTNSSFPLRKTPKGVQAYILWVGMDEASIAIESTLLNFHSYVQHFVFCCEGGLRMTDLHELFVLYRQEYMFQVERVMLLDKCVKTMVYVSRSEQFLCIDRGSLIEFCCEEMTKRDSCLMKMEFGCLLDRLFQEGMYVESASVLGDLIVTTDQVIDFQKQFTKIMQERYCYCTAIVRRASEAKALRTTAQNRLSEQNVPKFYQNTPLFGVIQHNSVNGNLSQSLATRKNLGVSFGRAISFKMGEWQL